MCSLFLNSLSPLSDGCAFSRVGASPRNITLPPSSRNFSSLSSVDERSVSHPGTTITSYSISPTLSGASACGQSPGSSDSLIKSKSMLPNSSHFVRSWKFLSSSSRMSPDLSLGPQWSQKLSTGWITPTFTIGTPRVIAVLTRAK